MPRNPHDVPCTFVTHPDQLVEIERALAGAQRVAIDTEVPIDGPRKHLLRVMSMAVRRADGSEQAFVVDARDVDPPLLGPVLAGVTADAWNANFDARVLDAAIWESADTTPDLTWWDAQIADALIHQGRSGFTWFHGLAWATGHYLGIEAEGKGTIQLSYTADDDLTEDQVAYAAADAVETLWVADAIRAELAAAGLETISDIEMAARPLLDRMERTGLPFDAEGWRSELDAMGDRHRATLGQLAVLTGGGQGSLFDDVIEPSWNPASEHQVRQALNRWSEAEVLAWTEHRYGKARHLGDLDSVTAGVLRSIGGELCETLLEFRSLSKILSTYGDSILEHLDDDGRMRPQYLQVVGTNTGRLASRNPNAQNFTPLMKPFVRPDRPERVFVHADLSQAELRYLAQVADDEPLRAAFARGDDVHVTTAATMFGFDRDQLERDDPARLKHLRQIAKALNFGIAYGTGAAALARSLTSEGAATTVDEAKELLAQYRRTYPGTAAWAEERIAEIQHERENTVAIDWPLTMRLARGFPAVRDIRRHFRRTENRWPSATEIAERHPDRDPADLNVAESDLRAEIEWLLAYSAPVALLADGTPFTFASRTLAGRRQQFNLHLDRLLLAVVVEAVADPSPATVAVRRRFETEHDVELWTAGSAPAENEIAKHFDDRPMRLRYVEMIVDDLGADGAEARLRRAARERVSVMVNAWRNAPIQGGVADIMLAAYGDLGRRLGEDHGVGHGSAVPVQTVHDSIVIECDLAAADAVAESVRVSLEEASLRFCPDVAPKADVDIRRSLADADVIRVHLPPETAAPSSQGPSLSAASGPMIPTADRETVQAILESNRAIHFYGLGDLGDFFWDRSRWWERDGALIGEIGLSDDPSDKTIYGINAQHPETALSLWADVDHLLPDRYFATGVLGFPEALAATGRHIELDFGHHTKMLLTNRDRLAAAAPPPPALRALTGDDLPAIAALREANPMASAFFAPHLIHVGPYVGIFDDGALVAMAGVHLCDDERSVAAVGGVLTDERHRGRGHARSTTAAVTRALVDRGIRTIGLNVKTANAAARTVYASLGYHDVHTYQEALVVRPNSETVV